MRNKCYAFFENHVIALVCLSSDAGASISISFIDESKSSLLPQALSIAYCISSSISLTWFVFIYFIFFGIIESNLVTLKIEYRFGRF